MVNKIGFVLVIFLLLVIPFILKHYDDPYHYLREGFENKKGNNSDDYDFRNTVVNIYDNFYANIYDDLMRDMNLVSYEVKTLKKIINENKKNQHFDNYDNSLLDLGSGTGNHVFGFNKVGYNAQGIDISNDMIEVAKKKYPDEKFQQGNFMDTMLVQPNSFSMITCLYFTIYYIKNKAKFFENCYIWLKPGGYLVIHLVNKKKFNPIVNGGDPLLIISAQNYSNERIKESVVDFNNFKYKGTFDLQGNDGIFNESFKFKNDNHTRQNEHHFYMENQTAILKKAENLGFKFIQQIHLGQTGYDFQYLYVLQKPF